RGGRTLSGRCLSYGEGITYWPVIEMVKEAAGMLQSDEPAATSDKLDRLLQGLPTRDQDELRTIAAGVASLVGAQTAASRTDPRTQLTQAELHWGIRRVLELLAAGEPLTLVFEDLHWAEPTLLELIRFLLEGSGPILVVCSARPELADAHAEFAAAGERLTLEAMGADESESLVRELLGRASLSESTLQTLLRNAGGNPLFLEETARMLAADGTEHEEGGDALPVPSTLQALIGSRLDQLSAVEKRLAQHASVIGTVFWPGALSHVAGENGAVAASLEGLERRDLIRGQERSTVAGEREYAFKHILIRDVAYERLPKGRRAELHVRFTEWTRALRGGEEEFVEIVAFHLEQACLLASAVARSPVPPPVDAAVEALRRAAEKAERREGFREADRYYGRALDLLPHEDAEKAIELRLRRGQTLTALGQLPRAHDELLEVAGLASAADRRDVRCAALVALANIDQKQGRADESHRRLVEAEGLAFKINDRCLQIRAGYEFAQVRADFNGEIPAAVEDLSRALVIAEELDDQALRIEGHLRLGSLFLNVGELDRAAEQLDRCLSLAAEQGSRRDEARATSWLGVVTYYRGEEEEAERLALQALAWLERTSDSYFQLQNLAALAKYALARGDPELAEKRLRDALPLALEGGGWLVIEMYRLLAQALVCQQRIHEARELVAFAARNLPEEDLFARAALLLAEAAVATACDERSAATGSYEEALRLLEEQQLVIELTETRLAFGRALAAFGETTGALTELERARTGFRRMGARRLLEQADDELARLAGA
ncbi:MAG: hypothetical protein M3322_02205, partial [Actinomycetota bacterium]|nr:hypothetical protein [Actinomycetota bacterium]